MLHRKLDKQIVTSSYSNSFSTISPVSKRITFVETQEHFQKRVKIVSIAVAAALFTSPIWATYMVKALSNPQNVSLVINGMKALIQ